MRVCTRTFSAALGVLLILWLSVTGCKVCAHADTPAVGQPFRMVLPNGVRLIFKPEPETSRVAVSLFIGARLDTTPNASAVGEMVARTLFYGNANRTQNSIQALIGEVGGSLDVLRSPELVAINYVAAPSQLPEALHLVCDCLKYATFAPESLGRALQNWREERQVEHTTAFARGYAAVTALLGQEEPEEVALRRVTQAQAQAYFQRQYVPARTVISIVGHFDAARTHGLLNAFLADYKRAGSAGVAKSAPASPLVQTAPSLLNAPGDSAYAFVATPAPSASSPDYPAFTVLQALLGGGHASRLFRQARETLGLGYEVGALYPAERSPALITYLQWNARRKASSLPDDIPAKSITADSVRNLLNGELDNIAAHPPDVAELNRARNVATGQDALRHERARDRAFLLGWYETLGLGYAYDTEFPRRLGGVTRDDILRVAKTYLRERASVMVLPSVP